jgi:predicted glycoside hydrolase/deacetylase ChbG (UPF0249 family)
VLPFLIVNADDFNLTEGVSRGIREAHRHGIVTSTVDDDDTHPWCHHRC